MSATAARNAPSVSPLSSASKTQSSPLMGAGDATTRGSGADGRAVNGKNDVSDLAADAADLSDDRSSSLSEPEDEDEDDDANNDMEDDVDDDQTSTAPVSLDVDSEAETERLELTPHKQRRGGNVQRKTPSKLSQSAAVEEELSDPPSPLPAGAGAASSTSTVAMTGKKRKRSETAESSLTSAASDLGESPPKRSHQAAVDPSLDADGVVDESEAPNGSTENMDDTPLPDELAVVGPTRGRGRKGKQKGRKARIPVEESEAEPTETTGEGEEETNEETAAKTEEELKQRNEASNLFEDLAKQFRAFRERLSTERIASLNAELELLSQPDCEHPEYLRQVACVEARLQKQRVEAHAFYSYRLRSIRERTLGERSQLHSQYFQNIRQMREDVLDQLGKDWYAIQTERRQNSQENDDAYVYRLPEKKSVQIRQQAKYNQEVSLLSGIAKYVGFPAAPEITGVEGNDLELDLKAMKLSKHLQSQTQPTAPVYLHKSGVSQSMAQSEKQAHDQFIEQNAWARPQGTVTNHGTPGISHTPDWAEPGYGTSGKLVRSLSSQHVGRQSSPFATPMAQRHPLADVSSSGTVAVNSDGPDVPSSVLAAPPTADRMMHHYQSGGRIADHQTSPLNVQKSRQSNHHNAYSGPELPSLRNISGLSSASTIEAAPEHAPDSETRKSAPSGFFSSFASEPRAPAFDNPASFHGSSSEDAHKQRDLYAAAANFRPHNPDSFAPSPARPRGVPSASSTGA